jgi:hypothetical protein
LDAADARIEHDGMPGERDRGKRGDVARPSGRYDEPDGTKRRWRKRCNEIVAVGEIVSTPDQMLAAFGWSSGKDSQ